MTITWVNGPLAPSVKLSEGDMLLTDSEQIAFLLFLLQLLTFVELGSLLQLLIFVELGFILPLLTFQELGERLPVGIISSHDRTCL